MRNSLLTLMMTAILVSLVSGTYAEAKQGRGKGKSEAREAAQSIIFTEREQQLIRRYFQTNTSNLPPGLAKRGGRLPPGLERQLRRNGTLPPGLQKRLQPFPENLSRQLPRLPAGYSRVILAGKALILDRDKRIRDLLSLVP